MERPEIKEANLQPLPTGRDSDYDIAIVGAGPAGSSAAIRLALAGKRVVLVEKEKFPRHKLCGEFISPECRDHFDELGVHDAMREAGGVEIAKTIFYSRSGKGVEVPSPDLSGVGSAHKHALGLSRAEMDMLLIARARQVGVDVFEETSVVDLLQENDTVVGVKTRARDIRARVTLDGSGRMRILARRASSGDGIRKAEFVAFKTHVSGCGVCEDTCEIFSYRRGYGGSSRVESGLHNLCFIAAAADVKQLGSDPERVLREIVCTNKRAAEVFKEINFVGEWHAVGIERYGRGEIAPQLGLLTIGDSAAFIDPFTGSGMLLALESARVAVEAIVTTDNLAALAEDYSRRYSATFDKRLRMCSLLRRVSLVPLLAETTIRALALSSGVRRLIVRATR
ncbi:MAG: FAD-dependent oxidoreductase [Pyrinomonadaceae bacterium]